MARNGLGIMEVQTRAADEACKILRGETVLLGNRRINKGTIEERWDGDDEAQNKANWGKEEQELDTDVYMTADE